MMGPVRGSARGLIPVLRGPRKNHAANALTGVVSLGSSGNRAVVFMDSIEMKPMIAYSSTTTSRSQWDQ